MKIIRIRSTPSPSVSPLPRVVCLDSSSSSSEDCSAPLGQAVAFYQKMDMLPSWDATAIRNDNDKNTNKKSILRFSNDNTISHNRTTDAIEEECELSDPSYQDKISAPSNCNDVHELGFSLSTFNFLSHGSSKVAWENNDALTKKYGRKFNEHYVVKTALYDMPNRKFEEEWRRNHRDAIIMERAGRVPNSYESNVLPLYQFCANTNVVPRATNVLDKFVKRKGKYMNAREVYHLALQAARGLYQVHAYKDGKATLVHADVKPLQFLIFEPPTRRILGGEERGNDLDYHHQRLPLLQINDFNRGEYVKQSINKNSTVLSCPLQEGCDKPDLKSFYRTSPEEYKECADRSAASDVYSLGNVLYFILSNGLPPFYQFSRETNRDYILQGKLPNLPSRSDYKHYKKFTDKEIDFVTMRQEHPLLVVVRDVMKGCWSFDAKDRPTSLEVVQMLKRGGQTFYYTS